MCVEEKEKIYEKQNIGTYLTYPAGIALSVFIVMSQYEF